MVHNEYDYPIKLPSYLYNYNAIWDNYRWIDALLNWHQIIYDTASNKSIITKCDPTLTACVDRILNPTHILSDNYYTGIKITVHIPKGLLYLVILLCLS